MNVPTIRRLTPAEAHEELDNLKSLLDMPLEEMELRASRYELSEREAGLWERISDLTWLLER